MYDYFLRSYGSTPYLIDNAIDLAYVKKMNDVGMATLTLPANHAAVSGLQLDDEIEIWRVLGGVQQVDFRGFYRGGSYRTSRNGRSVFDMLFVHEMDLLRRSVNAYKAGQENASFFTGKSADTVMTYVIAANFLNATQSFLGSVPRLTQATSKPVANGGYTGFGSVVSSYSAAYKNVLSVLQEMADVDKSMFHIRKLGSIWAFYVQPVTVTTDRRNEVFFDVDAQNMQDALLDQQQVGEMTVGFVAGQGEGPARSVEVRTTAARNIGNNNFEMFIDARHLELASSLQSYGDGVLNASRYIPKFTFSPQQLPSLNYGQHYFWGDVVSARYRGQTFVQRIMQVSVRKNDGRETVDIGLENIP